MDDEVGRKFKTLNDTVTESTNKISLCIAGVTEANRNSDIADTDHADRKSTDLQLLQKVKRTLNEHSDVIHQAKHALNDVVIKTQCELIQRERAGRKNLEKTQSSGDSGVYSADSTIIAQETGDDSSLRRKDDQTAIKPIVLTNRQALVCDSTYFPDLDSLLSEMGAGSKE